MTEILQVRLEKRGGFGIYRNDVLLIFNLDKDDVIAFNKEQRTFGLQGVQNERADFETKVNPGKTRIAYAGRVGKKLILGPHVDLCRDMIEQDPSTTAKDIEKHLRGLGIRFSSITAVTNLARKHGLKLAA